METEAATTQTTVAVATRATQTESALALGTPQQQLAARAAALDYFVAPLSSLRSTLRGLMRQVLRMPSSAEAAMDVRLELQGIPASAFRCVYPEAVWLTSPDGSVETGLVRSMTTLNNMISMEHDLEHGLGCCKLVLPAEARVGRAIIAFAPTWQVWCRQDPETLACRAVISSWMVILDESGELRTPPNHTWTDSDESSIQGVLRSNLAQMVEEDWAVSPNFLRLLGQEEKAAEVQELLEQWEQRKRARLSRRGAARSTRASACASDAPNQLPPAE